MNKRYLWDSKEFLYEVIPDEIYLTEDKRIVFFLKPHTDDNNDFDIEFQIDEHSGAIFDIVSQYNRKELIKILTQV